MLTKKQKILLEYIQARLQSSGVSPSFEEMKEHLGLKSKSGVHRLISALEERGFIKRLANRARALEIIKLPLDLANILNAYRGSDDVQEQNFVSKLSHYQTLDQNKKRTEQTVLGQYPNALNAPVSVHSHGEVTTDNAHPITTLNNNYSHQGPDTLPYGTSSSSNSSSAIKNGVLTLPLHGKIAAGTPIEALENIDSYIDVPYSVAAANGCYALTVSGDSMIEKGILNGDIVIIHSTQNAKDGDIVVALIDQEEATLKTFKLDGPNVLLVPANTSYHPQQYCAERVQVQGRLVGLVRSYS